MKIIFCSIGLHNWKLLRKANYENARLERLAIPIRRARRVCKICGKTQEQEIQYLGLKGKPKYTRHWVNVSKVAPDSNGKTTIIIDGAGALIVCDERTNRCYGLIPGNALGPLNKQGPCTILGKFAIGYPRR